jgi:hypothetical protein
MKKKFHDAADSDRDADGIRQCGREGSRHGPDEYTQLKYNGSHHGQA